MLNGNPWRGTPDVTLSWIPPEDLPEIPHGCIVALDTETHDPGLKEKGPGWAFDNGHIVGVSLAWGVDADHILGQGYWPIAHAHGNWRGGKGLLMRWLKKQFERDDLQWVFANSTYDLGWMNMLPIGKIHDIQVSAPLLNEHRRWYNLDSLAKDLLGKGKDDTLMAEWAKLAGVKKGEVKSMMALLPSAVVGPYAEQDAAATLGVHFIQHQRIIKRGLEKIYNLEMDLVPMFLELRKVGVRVDIPAAEKLRVIVAAEEVEAEKHLQHLTGLNISAWDIALQMQALRDEGFKGFSVTKKKQVEGLDAKVLEILATQQNKAGEIGAAILNLRRKNRLRVTFIDRMFLDHHHKGRLHAQFNSLKGEDGGTVSGRISSTDPNLQQLPARDEEAARRIRSLVLPEEGELFASVDYSSQEPRLAVHYGVQEGLRSAIKMASEYHKNPNLDIHQLVAELMGIDRKKAKILNLAQMYGQGGGSLCIALGLPTEPASFVNDGGQVIEYIAPLKEGKQLLENYNQTVPFMKRLAKSTERQAREEGHVETLLGRHCHVFNYPNGGDDARKAFNRRIQGSGADMIKRSMLDAWRAGFKLRLTVHDENLFSVQNKKQALECAHIMISAVKLEVPVTCDLAVGENWGSCVDVAL